ncbi:hypothetical protein, partial [Paenibacillus oryzisoli]|uniref:hypothetical protein n=1 Tax=Paenibacillus oryzisoli TaxID=1850517 RepID=UPI0012F907A7
MRDTPRIYKVEVKEGAVALIRRNCSLCSFRFVLGLGFTVTVTFEVERVAGVSEVAIVVIVAGVLEVVIVAIVAGVLEVVIVAIVTGVLEVAIVAIVAGVLEVAIVAIVAGVSEVAIVVIVTGVLEVAIVVEVAGVTGLVEVVEVGTIGVHDAHVIPIGANPRPPAHANNWIFESISQFKLKNWLEFLRGLSIHFLKLC